MKSRILYTPEEVSEMLGGIIHPETVRVYCRRRIIKAHKIARSWHTGRRNKGTTG